MARLHRIALVAVAASTLAAGPAQARSTLQQGDHGTDVLHLQERLAKLTYLSKSAVTGSYDARTWHAVVAFQGWRHLTRDGIAGPRTRRVLRRAKKRPAPESRRQGFEIHVGEQVMLLVRKRKVVRAIHVSTGAGGATPLGRFSVYRRELMSWSVKFKVWMPFAQYFYGGYAMHEYPSVPAYPASHGCVRLPAHEAERVWDFGKHGMRVWVVA